MSEWNEQRVRKEASWQAFKEGKSLLQRARVEALKINGNLATASFRSGKRKLRTVVRMSSQLEVECQCAENRNSGAICPHGVAVVLASLSDADNPTDTHESTTTKAALPLEAYQVIFPPGFERGMQAGRVGVRLQRSEETPTELDQPLVTWLSERAPDAHFPLLTTLQGDEAATFLDALAAHPRLFRKTGELLTSASEPMAPIQLADSELRQSRVRLITKTQVTPIRWGRGLGWIDGDAFGRAPSESSSVHWRDEAIELIEDGQLELTLDSFLAEIDAWMNLLQAPYRGWLGKIRFETQPSDVTIKIEGSLNALDLTLSSHDTTGPELSSDGHTILTPDRSTYQRTLLQLTDLGFKPQGDQLCLRDHDQITAFLADGIPELEKTTTIVIGQRLQHVRRSLHVIRPHFEFGSGNSLSCELSFQTDGGKIIPRAKVLEILRSGKSSVKTRGGAEVMVSRAISDELEPLLADLGVVRPEGRLQLNRAQQECLKRAAQPGKALPIPRSVPHQAGEATLRDYQWQGADWILDRWKHFGGALLADEMGLGKTLQTISAVNQLKRENDLGTALVLVPTSLLSNWEIELQRFAPALKVVRLHGSQRDSLREAASTADIVLTSYGTLVRDLAFHLKQEYRTLIADEASLLRNPDSEISRTVAKLKPARRLALTGTPVENRLRDLWSIFRLVSPGFLGSKDEFLERYEQGGAAEASRLRTRISPFVLRRTKSQVAKDLPARVEIDQWLDLSPDARALYREVAQAGLNQWEALEEAGNAGAASMHLLTTLLRLRQICLEPTLVGNKNFTTGGGKLEWLEAHLIERCEEGRKTLVFSQFAEFLRICENRLNGRDLKIFRLDGSTSNRGNLVKDFQSCSRPAVFLISLKAGGYGLNLTAADTVIHMDPWWNPAAEAQASDRAHRIGQTQPVSIYRLLIKNSVEERVRRLQIAKQALISQLHDGELPTNWSQEDVRGLLTP